MKQLGYDSYRVGLGLSTAGTAQHTAGTGHREHSHTAHKKEQAGWLANCSAISFLAICNRPFTTITS